MKFTPSELFANVKLPLTDDEDREFQEKAIAITDKITKGDRPKPRPLFTDGMLAALDTEDSAGLSHKIKKRRAV